VARGGREGGLKRQKAFGGGGGQTREKKKRFAGQSKIRTNKLANNLGVRKYNRRKDEGKITRRVTNPKKRSACQRGKKTVGLKKKGAWWYGLGGVDGRGQLKGRGKNKAQQFIGEKRKGGTIDKKKKRSLKEVDAHKAL